MQKHWVEDLFPPTFVLDSTDITNPKGLSKKSSTNRYEAIYEKVKREFDAELFERRQKGVQTEETTDQVIKSLQTSLFSGAETDDSQQDEEEKENLWSSDEIEVLRSVFLKTKKENLELHEQLKSAQFELLKANEKNLKLEKESSTLKEERLHLRKTQKRNMINIKHLERELGELVRNIRIVESDLQERKEENMQLKQKLRSQRKELVSEIASRRETEISLEKLGKNVRLEEMRKTERIKIEYDMQNHKLLQQLNEMRKLLQEEKVHHDQTKKSLELLRYHFASLPQDQHVHHSGNNSCDDVLQNFQTY